VVSNKQSDSGGDTDCDADTGIY